MMAQQRIANAASTRLSMNRVCVFLVSLCWLAVAAQFPYSLQGTGILILLGLVALDVVLGSTSARRRSATAPTASASGW
jgi:hypothetical protein